VFLYPYLNTELKLPAQVVFSWLSTEVDPEILGFEGREFIRELFPSRRNRK
jgi:hypothetical protein